MQMVILRIGLWETAIRVGNLTSYLSSPRAINQLFQTHPHGVRSTHCDAIAHKLVDPRQKVVVDSGDKLCHTMSMPLCITQSLYLSPRPGVAPRRCPFQARSDQSPASAEECGHGMPLVHVPRDVSFLKRGSKLREALSIK